MAKISELDGGGFTIKWPENEQPRPSVPSALDLFHAQLAKFAS